MTFDDRIVALGVDLSDLPKGYSDDQLALAAEAAEMWSCRITWRRYCDYILHLTDIIDRLETHLDNLLNLYDRNAHIVANTDPPEGVTLEQFNAVVHAIYESWEKARAGLEPWDAWYKEDDSLSDAAANLKG